MDYEEYKRKALEPIVNYIESAMASYSKEEIEARIKKALPEKESEDERIRKRIHLCLDECVHSDIICDYERDECLAYLEKLKDERELVFIEGKMEGVRQTCQEIKDAMSLFEPKDLTPFEFTFRDYIDSAIRYCLSGEGYQQYIKEWAADLLNLEKQKDEARRQFNLGVEAGREEVLYEMEKEQKPIDLRDSRQIALMIENGRRSGVIEGRKQVVDNPEKYGLCKPAEWSEEDEAIANLIIRELEQDKKDAPEYSRHFARLLNWFTHRFKSLRPQPHWKPSEEQMDALNKVIHEADLPIPERTKLMLLEDELKKLL